MKTTRVEFVVGLFLAIGIGWLAWLSLSLARKEFIARNGYELQAAFSNASGLRGAPPWSSRVSKLAESRASGWRIPRPRSAS